MSECQKCGVAEATYTTSGGCRYCDACADQQGYPRQAMQTEELYTEWRARVAAMVTHDDPEVRRLALRELRGLEDAWTWHRLIRDAIDRASKP